MKFYVRGKIAKKFRDHRGGAYAVNVKICGKICHRYKKHVM